MANLIAAARTLEACEKNPNAIVFLKRGLLTIKDVLSKLEFYNYIRTVFSARSDIAKILETCVIANITGKFPPKTMGRTYQAVLNLINIGTILLKSLMCRLCRDDG